MVWFFDECKTYERYCLIFGVTGPREGAVAWSKIRTRIDFRSKNE